MVRLPMATPLPVGPPGAMIPNGRIIFDTK